MRFTIICNGNKAKENINSSKTEKNTVLAVEKERLGWERTYLLAAGGGIGALIGVLVTAYLIHLSRKSK